MLLRVSVPECFWHLNLLLMCTPRNHSPCSPSAPQEGGVLSGARHLAPSPKVPLLTLPEVSDCQARAAGFLWQTEIEGKQVCAALEWILTKMSWRLSPFLADI